MKKIAKKIAKKVLKRIVGTSRPCLDVTNQEIYYPVRWVLLGITIWNGYESKRQYMQEHGA